MTCLVVTRLKECLDASEHLVFISNSVPDYLDKEWLDSAEYDVLKGDWETDKYQNEAKNFAVTRLERYRSELGDLLNKKLNLNYDKKSLGILLDPWLLIFVAVVYDRVNKLENGMLKYSDAYIYQCVDKVLPPLTTNDFLQQCQNDKFNQYLYSTIAKKLGVLVKKCCCRDNKSTNNNLKMSWKGKVYFILLPIFRQIVKFWILFKRPLVIIDGFFPTKESINIALKSLGKIVLVSSDFLWKKQTYNLSVNNKSRNNLNVLEKDKYDVMANCVLKTCFPMSLLENLDAYNKRVSSFSEIPVLGTAISHYWNDTYKILSAQIIRKNGKLIGFQHGGVTNHTYPHITEAVGENLVDEFFVWKHQGRCGFDLPAPKLRKIKSFRESRQNRKAFVGILFVSTSPSIYLYRHFINDTDNFVTMIENQNKFYLSLHDSIKKDFILRAYPDDRGWRYKERWLDVAKNNLTFDSTRNIYESLIGKKIYISDHISTTWIEAFYIGIPVLLYFDLDRYNMYDNTKEVFENLISVGILHPTPESAAMFLNDTYNAINEWWTHPDTQSAIKQLIDISFGSDVDFVELWSDELLSIRHTALAQRCVYNTGVI